jgi:hypothetical protein
MPFPFVELIIANFILIVQNKISGIRKYFAVEE